MLELEKRRNYKKVIERAKNLTDVHDNGTISLLLGEKIKLRKI